MNNLLDDNIKKMHCLQEYTHDNYLKIDRKSFFCEIQDIPRIRDNFLLLPTAPSTVNFTVDMWRKYDNLVSFFQLLNHDYQQENYCNIDETLHGITKEYSELADRHQIDFFMHYTTNSKLLMYITAIMSPFKLKYLGVGKLLGTSDLVSYVQAVKNGIKVVDTINAHAPEDEQVNQKELSDYFIFSKDILDVYEDWHANYGWLYGKKNKGTSHYKKEFGEWINDYQNIDHSLSYVKASDTVDTNWPIVNEFIFRNPVSLKFCLKIVISKRNQETNPLFMLFKLLCPNTIMDLDTFESNRGSYNFHGINNELLNLNYDLIYSFIEEGGDVNNLNSQMLNQFRTNNGMNKIYAFDPPKIFLMLTMTEFDIPKGINELQSHLITTINQMVTGYIPVYKYIIYDDRAIHFSKLLKHYHYNGKFKNPFVVLIINSDVTTYDTDFFDKIYYKFDVKVMEISEESMKIYLEQIENGAINIANEIIQKLKSYQHGNGIHYRKYIKYKTKYLTLRRLV
ncbi:MAG: hypothetical protein Satyrvirus19_12 [Satyrvirus sp.]|uniref:Uncharacterized protein n=1 Tax=Satyrvirus sp. TaxID=2487771 RepID=A0A3G5AE82_9VIRU|nr:MAG: hypothetical protein Satyrvirus19_12 [Satyrvirus sp.]